MSDLIKLYYFPARGRAEAMRLCFAAADKKYEDIRLTKEEWGIHKPKSPYGQMPYIEYKGRGYGESKAIATFIARECGMAGKTSEEQMRVEEVYSLVTSLMDCMAKAHFEQDEQKKATCMKENTEQNIPKYLGFFEKILKETGTGYFVGSGLTLADCSVHNITFGLLKMFPKVLEGFPLVQKNIKLVESDPNVKKYLESRPKTDM